MTITPTDIVAAARQWLGTPYAHQANLGFDLLMLSSQIEKGNHNSIPSELALPAPNLKNLSNYQSA